MRYTLTRDAAICIVRWCCQHWCTSLRCLRPSRSAQKQRGSSHRRSNRCLRRAHRTRFNNSYYPCRSVFQHPMTTCYECPRWDPYDRPTFDDLPLTIWWCVVTMTGVGYGAALLHNVATTYEDNDNLLYCHPAEIEHHTDRLSAVRAGPQCCTQVTCTLLRQRDKLLRPSPRRWGFSCVAHQPTAHRLLYKLM